MPAFMVWCERRRLRNPRNTSNLGQFRVAQSSDTYLRPTHHPRHRRMRPSAPTAWCWNTKRRQLTSQPNQCGGPTPPQPLDLDPNPMRVPVRLTGPSVGRSSRTRRYWGPIAPIPAQHRPPCLGGRQRRPCALADQLARLLGHSRRIIKLSGQTYAIVGASAYEKLLSYDYETPRLTSSAIGGEASVQS